MGVTIKQIADEIGVSSATVSLVINNRPGVSEARREQINAKIKELKYHTVSKRAHVSMRNIGFLVFYKSGCIISDSPFFLPMLGTLSNQLIASNYNLVMLRLNCAFDLEPQIRQIRNSECDGLLVFATEALSEDIPLLRSLGLPFVIVDNFFCDQDVDTVCIYNEQGIRKGIDYLLENNHRSIGYIRSSNVINSFLERFDVFSRVMAEKGLTVNPSHVLSLPYEQAKFTDEFNRILAQKPADLPTAFMADNDILAINAMKVLQANHIHVPRDISMIGFDNRSICEMSKPQLTTIAVSPNDLASISLSLLKNRLSGFELNSCIKISIGVSLVERDSVLRLEG